MIDKLLALYAAYDVIVQCVHVLYIHNFTSDGIFHCYVSHGSD